MELAWSVLGGSWYVTSQDKITAPFVGAVLLYTMFSSFQHGNVFTDIPWDYSLGSKRQDVSPYVDLFLILPVVGNLEELQV